MRDDDAEDYFVMNAFHGRSPLPLLRVSASIRRGPPSPPEAGPASPGWRQVSRLRRQACIARMAYFSDDLWEARSEPANAGARDDGVTPRSRPSGEAMPEGVR